MCPFEEGDRSPLVDAESQLWLHENRNVEKPLKRSWKGDGYNVVCTISISQIFGLFIIAILLGAMVPLLCQNLTSQHMDMHQSIVAVLDDTDKDTSLNNVTKTRLEDKNKSDFHEQV